MPNVGDELHHFGWNACSSALCPWAPHPHVERRYLLVPGLRSSRIHVLDVKDDPRSPKLVKVVEAEEIARKAGYSRPHTVHCGPDGIYVSALGNPEGDGPGGIFLLDHDDFSVKGAWEADRGPQELAYDFWWHLNHDTVITSEWGTPNMVEDGLVGELLLGNKYGHRLHVFNLKTRKHVQEIDLGAEHQMVLELRPAHDPSKTYGFVGVVASTADLTASIWLWERAADGTVTATKVITIPPEPAETEQLPPILQPFGAVPPLITDIALSVDDQDLYVSCWGTGELKRFDVSDPRSPRETGSVRLGGIVERAAHPASGPLNGGPQMVEVEPRRPPRLPHELALRRVGRAVLPRGDRRLARQARRRRGRLADHRSGPVRRVLGRAAAPGAARRRRRVLGLLLLPERLTWTSGRC